jgi:hypothetical protein
MLFLQRNRRYAAQYSFPDWFWRFYKEIAATRLNTAFRIGFGVSTKKSPLRGSGSAGFRLCTQQIIHELSDLGVRSNPQSRNHE